MHAKNPLAYPEQWLTLQISIQQTTSNNTYAYISSTC